MKIDTKFFGTMEIEEENKLTFPQGIPGFQEEKAFVLLDLKDNSLFQVLQSIRNSHNTFIVTNPYYYYKDYDIELDNSILELLEIETEQDVTVLSILSLKDPFENSTINLQAPIIVNHAKQRGKQYITNSKHYSTKHPFTTQSLSFTAKED